MKKGEKGNNTACFSGTDIKKVRWNTIARYIVWRLNLVFFNQYSTASVCLVYLIVKLYQLCII